MQITTRSIVARIVLATAALPASAGAVDFRGIVHEGSETVAGARVRFAPQRAGDGAPRECTTDGEGHFRIDVEPGAWRVAVLPRPPLPERRAAGDPVTDVTVEKMYDVDVPDAPSHELMFVLPVADLEVRVTSSDGAPVAGAPVVLEAAHESDALAWLRARGPWVTDGRGRFRVRGLEPGDYRVAAGGAGPGDIVPNLRPCDAAAAEVRTNRAGRVERVLEHSGRRVTGRVVGPRGARVAGARVHVFGEDGAERTRSGPVVTGRDGTFDVVGLCAEVLAVAVDVRDGDVEGAAPGPCVVEGIDAREEDVALGPVPVRPTADVKVDVTWTPAEETPPPLLEVRLAGGARLDQVVPRTVRPVGTGAARHVLRLQPGAVVLVVRHGDREVRRPLEVGERGARVRLDLRDGP